MSVCHSTQIRCILIQILIIQRFSDIKLGLPVADFTEVSLKLNQATGGQLAVLRISRYSVAGAY